MLAAVLAYGKRAPPARRESENDMSEAATLEQETVTAGAPVGNRNAAGHGGGVKLSFNRPAMASQLAGEASADADKASREAKDDADHYHAVTKHRAAAHAHRFAATKFVGDDTPDSQAALSEHRSEEHTSELQSL